MSNENNYEFNNEERGAHEGQSGHGAKRPYNRQKNYKYKSQHRNNYNRKSGLNGERKQQIDALRFCLRYVFEQGQIENQNRTGTKPH